MCPVSYGFVLLSGRLSSSCSPRPFFCLPAVEGGGRKREQESTDIVITCKFSILFLRGGKGSSSRLPRTSHFFLSFLLFCFTDVFLSPVSPFRKTATTVQ